MELGKEYLGNPFAWFDLPPRRQALLIAWHNQRTKPKKGKTTPVDQNIGAPNSAEALQRARMVLGLTE